MNTTCEAMNAAIEADLKKKYGVLPEKASAVQLHEALSSAVMDSIAENWENSREAHKNGRRACYLSMEFLVGRAIYNNLLCAGLTETAEAALNKAGRSLSDLEEIEDAALGNGGLGRLAACFLDSAAAHDLPR